MEKQVIFWQKVFNNRDKSWKKVPSFSTLIPVKGVVVGDSTPICGYCGDQEVVHRRRNRRHLFQNPISGLTINVTYVGGKTGTMKNVQQGKEANCWTEETK